MRRITGLAAALLVGLAGCPLPQALPEAIAATGGFGPRIPYEQVSPQATFIDVRKDCTSAPVFTLRATLTDRDQQEAVEARWFVDYDPASNYGPVDRDFPAGNDQNFLRPVRDFPYALPADPSFAPHVVELVVSNDFKPRSPTDALPNRMPTAEHDTQTFRWLFRYVDAGGSCGE